MKIKIKKNKPMSVIIKTAQVKPELEDLEITPSGVEQNFKSNKYGYNNVKVKAVESEELTITPNTEEQVKEGMFNKVTVAGDTELKAENIKEGVNIFGVEGTAKTTNAKITSGYYLFYNSNRIDYVNELLSLCENINSAYAMFSNSSKITELDLSNLDTSNVTTMYNMFTNCNNLTKLDVSNFNTSNVTTMEKMFAAIRVTELDVSSFDTSNVTTMESMFNGCYRLTKLDLSSFDTSNVNKMNRMFYGLNSLTELNLSNFNTSNVTTMESMFNGCSGLTKLDIRNFSFDKVTSSSNMFYSVPADCLVIVKGDTEKQWVLNVRSSLTNVKTVAELGS